MFQRWRYLVLLGMLVGLFVAKPAGAVEVFKVSNYGSGHQIWFETEAFDERNPDTDQSYEVTGKAVKAPDGAFGEAINRTGAGGGMIRWTFDISKADGKSGTWYFWAREINPSNQSDYMLVKDDPDDGKIPNGPPFPQGDGTPPFNNADDRIFEENVGPPWGWARSDHSEGHTKELQDGENTMYIFHRQGERTVFWDVFMWTDNAAYRPIDDDYINAEEMKTGLSVAPQGKLAVTWADLKSQ